jgi:hypothetical protein
MVLNVVNGVGEMLGWVGKGKMDLEKKFVVE